MQVMTKVRKQETTSAIAVELSNYPPNLTRHDIQVLFKGFSIALDFVLPTVTRFAYPFRTFVWITGQEEAERAVRELSGKVMGGRQIRLTLVDLESYEQKEVVVAELVDELKIAIVSKYSNHPHLQIREADSS
jgi:hypothetical protein